MTPPTSEISFENQKNESKIVELLTNDFLKSLNMKGMLNDINKQNFDRAVQLTQKVNQFN